MNLIPVRHLLFVAVLAGVLGMLPGSASAKVLFGTKERLHKLQDVQLKGPQGQQLYLGYKFSHHSFLLPYMTTDDGYVLGVVGAQQYIKLDHAQMAAMQASGKLPSPLPHYQISLLDYAMGFLLWPVLAVIALVTLFGMRKNRQFKTAIPHITTAVEHHRAGRSQEALASYNAALAIHAENPIALVNRGQLLGGLGRSDAAIADYSRAIKANPKNAIALLSRGQAFLKKGLFDQALSDLTRAVTLSKGAAALQARASVYSAKGQYDEAVNDLTRAITIEPSVAALYAQRGASYERKGDAERAAADFAKARQLGATAQQTA